MGVPGFTAGSAVGKASRTYRGNYRYGNASRSQAESPEDVLLNQLDDLERPVGVDETDFTAEIEDEELGVIEELTGDSEADLIEAIEDAEAEEEALEELDDMEEFVDEEAVGLEEEIEVEEEAS